MQDREMAVQPWWILAVAGVATILFGIVAIAWPGITLFVLVSLWGAYALIYGIVSLFAAFRAIRSRATWWTHLLVGVISLGAGMYVFANMFISSVALLYVIAIWALVVGTAEIVAGLAVTNFGTVVVGVISVLFGLLLFANPATGALGLVWAIGVFAIIRGIVLLVAAFRAPSVTGTTPD
ncbi:MAG: HdeD family acid-resistance protein [Chloroflexota bacterium]